jgi:hypothetical protein
MDPVSGHLPQAWIQNWNSILDSLYKIHYFFIFCCTGGTLWHLPNLLQSIILLYSPSPHSWNSFNRSHFSIFIFEYIIFLPYSFFYTFSLYPPPSYWCQLPRQELFYLPHFGKRHFCLYNVTIWEVTFWHFHVYVYYNPNWFILSIFLLMVISTGLKTLYSFLNRKYINHIHILNFLWLPSLSH